LLLISSLAPPMIEFEGYYNHDGVNDIQIIKEKEIDNPPVYEPSK